MAWLSSLICQKQVFGRQSPICRPIWRNFVRYLLMHGLHCGFNFTPVCALAQTGLCMGTNQTMSNSFDVIHKMYHKSSYTQRNSALSMANAYMAWVLFSAVVKAGSFWRAEPEPNKKLSWCWQTRETRLEVSQGQIWYQSMC